MPGVQIIKPEWVMHGEAPGAPIYSLDISPDGSRLATGGGDCKVKIWNMVTIRDENVDGAKMLSASAHHTHTVNCVRWSPCGRYLASCADDRLVLVLHLGAQFSLTVPGEKEANKENWVVYRTYKGHEKDVLHVAWCPKTSRLASCGVDNQILVWKLSEEKLPIVRLRCNGMVKGIAWDPIGKYLAAQGTGWEEKSTCVWRVRDWQMEVKSEKPFRSAPDETMFLRLSWSPDGQSLATANAFVRKKNACALLGRGSGSGDYANAEWESEASFMGWRAPVTVAAFHPKLLKRQGKMDACCAIGGCDGTLTLWSANSNGRPLIIVNELFRKQIFDITWGGDGYTLSVCSHDGSVAVLVLTAAEIGAVASQQETTAELRKIYGDLDGGMAEHHLPEDAFQLDLEAGVQPLVTTNAPPVPQVTRDKQFETKNKDGKRKIMPKVLAAPSADLTTPPPLPPGALPPSHVQPDARDANSAAKQPDSFSDALSGTPGGGAANAGAPAAGASQQAPAAQAPAPAPQLTAAEQQKQKQQAAELQKAQLAESKKRKAQSQGKPEDGKKEKRAAVDRAGEAAGAAGGGQGQGQGQAVVVVGNLLPARKAEQSQSRQIRAGDAGAGAGAGAGALVKAGASSLFLNATKGSNGWTAISLTNEEGLNVWSDMLKEPVEALAGNEKMCVVACKDGSIYAYSQAGRRLMPPVLVGSQVSVLEVSEAPECHLLVATCAGRLLVWDVLAQRQLCAVDLGAFLRGTAIQTAWVTPTGQPMLAMANGHCLTFHQGMQTMVRVADDHFVASSLFSQVRATLAAPDAKKGHLARALELASTSFRAQSVPAMISMDLAQQQEMSLSHAETLVASALVLQSGAEFKHWLDAYVGMLVDQELEPRLREVLELLMPSAVAGGTRQGDKAAGRMLLGLSRRELVSGVLQAMGRKRALQRCIAEFNYLLRAEGGGDGEAVAPQ